MCGGCMGLFFFLTSLCRVWVAGAATAVPHLTVLTLLLKGGVDPRGWRQMIHTDHTSPYNNNGQSLSHWYSFNIVAMHRLRLPVHPPTTTSKRMGQYHKMDQYHIRPPTTSQLQLLSPPYLLQASSNRQVRPSKPSDQPNQLQPEQSISETVTSLLSFQSLFHCPGSITAVSFPDSLLLPELSKSFKNWSFFVWNCCL